MGVVIIKDLHYVRYLKKIPLKLHKSELKPERVQFERIFKYHD